MPTPQNHIIADIVKQVKKSRKDIPNWPDHAVAQGAVVASAGSDLLKACQTWKYARKDGVDEQTLQINNMKEEAIKVAAAAFRFIENLK